MLEIDTTGWSTQWRARLARAYPGLSVPGNTPRGRSERRFLALFDGVEARSFRSLCRQVGEPPNDSWGSVERWVRDLLMGLKRVGSVTYDKGARVWVRTDRGAAVADANAEWAVGPVDDVFETEGVKLNRCACGTAEIEPLAGSDVGWQCAGCGKAI